MKKFIGTVVSTKMHSSAVVKIDTFWQHPVYQKRVKRSRKYLVHDEIGVKIGDKVMFQETKPMSRLKRWKIVQIVKKQ